MYFNTLEDFGFDSFFVEQCSAIDEGLSLVPARILDVQKELYAIAVQYGDGAIKHKHAKLKATLFYDNPLAVYPTVGDFVLVHYNPLGDDIIYRVLERRSKFSRLDSWRGSEQLVAANFDYVFIMTSLNHDFNIKRLERYLAAAWQSGAVPVIILTKSDLVTQGEYEDVAAQIESIAIGVPTAAISSVTGAGIEALDEYLKPGKTVVFLGSSGVGKSSLVNALFGFERMSVKEIRDDDAKGRHTTTSRNLLTLPRGCMIIDTPGMRELGIWNAGDGLNTAFSEIAELAEQCRFKDCAHENEPGCAVRTALESGILPRERWANFIKLKKEARFTQRKEERLERARKKLNGRSF